ncbi:DUF6542 domain-containing protein [Goodfellowiella coeruleoviolacea]|uniref:DUF6542 domain-containing protein n=1 Tax=Goodfellowiella coeruleoviolacea TaxID=334858 RepID=A0AAE3KET5_9PSEU|nr:DUF6542 domain-containing protein [Goodfellowiella coeruleoviolacea]MCP2165666.1 hypothetical protein [Goodfellowiella coeruleoviolacea]
MTATRDRRDDLDGEPTTTTPWNDRAIVGSFRGLPWWAAVIVALLLSVVCAYLNMQSQSMTQQSLGLVFQVGYFLGCLLAVLGVRRRSLFGPMVQPPLILAITVVVAVLLTSGLPSGGMTGKALVIGTPLINSFPIMAITTAVTVLVGVLRMLTQRDPHRLSKDERQALRSSRDDDDLDGPAERRGSARASATRAGRADDERRPGRQNRSGAPAKGRPAADRPRREGGSASPDRARGRRPRPRDEDDFFDD